MVERLGHLTDIASAQLSAVQMADLSVAHWADQLELHLVQLMVVTTDIQTGTSTDTLTGYHLVHWTENWKVD